MSRKSVLLAAGLAVAMIAIAVLGTFWILRQPVPEPSDQEPFVAGAPVEPASSPNGEPEQTDRRIQVSLYVLARSGDTLATETQEIQLEDSLQEQAKQVVRLLVRRSASIPRGAELRELFITPQGVAFVDFSRELVANHPGGSSAEELTVYSLSNTLIANFPGIKSVKILVEGREISTLAGHLDLSIPYGRGPLYLQPDSERPETPDEAS